MCALSPSGGYKDIEKTHCDATHNTAGLAVGEYRMPGVHCNTFLAIIAMEMNCELCVY